MGEPRYVRYVFASAHGNWMLRVGQTFYGLKAPWNPPLFSERYSARMKTIPLGRGWRLFRRDISPSTKAETHE